MVVLATWMMCAGTIVALMKPDRPKRWAGFARGMAALTASLLIGCGGGGGGGGGGGPYPTTTSMSIQQSATQLQVVVSVHSSGATPTGNISLVVDPGVPMMGGVSSGVTTFSFSPIPAVDLYTLIATYSGDANNQASNSGQQTTTLTGNTTIQVSGTSGGINTTVKLPLTLN